MIVNTYAFAIYIFYILVINDFGIEFESTSTGIRMLPTPDKKGLYVISEHGIFEVSFNTASFTFKKSTVNDNAFADRYSWPVAISYVRRRRVR